MTIEQQAHDAFEKEFGNDRSTGSKYLDQREGFLAAYKLLAEDAERYQHVLKNGMPHRGASCFWYSDGELFNTPQDAIDAAIKAARTKGAEHG